MTEGLRICHRGGRLVVGSDAIPEAPFDFVWPSVGPSFGCNRLTCGECGGPVKQQPGWVRLGAPSPTEVRALFESEAWDGLPGIRAAPSSRLYVCACGHTYEPSVSRFVEDPGKDDFGGPPPPNWRCAGHPRIRRPVLMDGEAISASSYDWTSLAEGVLRGERAEGRPGFTDEYACCWLQRLYHLLPSSDASELSQAMAQCVSRQDPRLQDGAIDFYRRLPLAEGAEALNGLVASGGASLTSTPRPDRPGESVGDLLQLALGERLKALAVDSPEFSAARDAAREAVQWPSYRTPVLLRDLSALDSAWVLANLRPLLGPNPKRGMLRALVIGFYRAGGESRAEDLVRALRDAALGEAEVLALVLSHALPAATAQRLRANLQDD